MKTLKQTLLRLVIFKQNRISQSLAQCFVYCTQCLWYGILCSHSFFNSKQSDIRGHQLKEEIENTYNVLNVVFMLQDLQCSNVEGGTSYTIFMLLPCIREKLLQSNCMKTLCILFIFTMLRTCCIISLGYYLQSV